MMNIVNSYKEISQQILKLLKLENLNYNQLDDYLEKRQALIENIGNDVDLFKAGYNSEKLNIIDSEIQSLLKDIVSTSKKELLDYRRQQNCNTAYVNMNKTNLNLFSKKV